MNSICPPPYVRDRRYSMLDVKYGSGVGESVGNGVSVAVGSCVGVAGGVFVNVGAEVAVPVGRLQEVKENAAKPINNRNRLI